MDKPVKPGPIVKPGTVVKSNGSIAKKPAMITESRKCNLPTEMEACDSLQTTHDGRTESATVTESRKCNIKTSKAV